MLNSLIKQKMKGIQMPTFKNQYVLCKHIELGKMVNVIMMPITKEQSDAISFNSYEGITLKNEKHKYTVESKNIIIWGNLDFNDERDLDVLSRLKFLSYLQGTGVPIPENYEYETHKAYTPTDRYILGETWDTTELIKFAHASLNKPEYIIMFKHYGKLC